MGWLTKMLGLEASGPGEVRTITDDKYKTEVLYFHQGRIVERVVGYRALHYHREYLEKELLPRIERPTPAS